MYFFLKFLLGDSIESWTFLSIIVLNRVSSILFFFLSGYYYIFMLITPWSDSFGCAALNNTLNASAKALSLVSYCVCAQVCEQRISQSSLTCSHTLRFNSRSMILHCHVNVAADAHEKTRADDDSHLQLNDFVRHFGYCNITLSNLISRWRCTASLQFILWSVIPDVRIWDHKLDLK